MRTSPLKSALQNTVGPTASISRASAVLRAAPLEKCRLFATIAVRGQAIDDPLDQSRQCNLHFSAAQRLAGCNPLAEPISPVLELAIRAPPRSADRSGYGQTAPATLNRVAPRRSLPRFRTGAIDLRNSGHCIDRIRLATGGLNTGGGTDFDHSGHARRGVPLNMTVKEPASRVGRFPLQYQSAFRRHVDRVF